MIVHQYDPFSLPLTAAYPVAVIDVCRAFTTAAYILAQGAERIILVRELNEAFLAKQKFPGAYLIGEDRGYPISGFDYWNSPAQVMGVDFSGATIIQRTTAGTRAMDMCRHAPELLATSFVVAGATIKYLSSTNQNETGLVSSGWSLAQDGPAEEDAACARYLAAGLLGS